MPSKLLPSIFLGILFGALAVAKGDEDYMVELTDKTFEDAVKESEFMIVEFYANW